MLGGSAITNDVENPTTLALDGSGNLYVGNSTSSNEGNVSVYAPKSVQPLRTLSGVVGVPKGLVANDVGRLFVVAQYRSGCCQLVGTGGVYAAGGTKPRENLKGLSGFAHSPVLDRSGNLYVGNFDVFPGWVSVYPRGHHIPSHVINTGIGLPIQLALTPDGDLVVLNGLFSGGYNVTVYPAGTGTPSLTITAGLHQCTGIAVDADGNIYVANDKDKTRRGSVTAYQSGQTTLWRSIHAGITSPAALAFDSSGRLYVANVPRKGANSIVVFAPGGSTPMHKYRLREEFSALAVPR
jgi:sugar lactone lactonase YvrE